MDKEITNNGTFWLPARRQKASVSCRYHVVFERDHYVYRLMYITENGPVTA